jgi:hypothetical protein
MSDCDNRCRNMRASDLSVVCRPRIKWGGLNAAACLPMPIACGWMPRPCLEFEPLPAGFPTRPKPGGASAPPLKSSPRDRPMSKGSVADAARDAVPAVIPDEAHLRKQALSGPSHQECGRLPSNCCSNGLRLAASHLGGPALNDARCRCASGTCSASAIASARRSVILPRGTSTTATQRRAEARAIRQCRNTGVVSPLSD